MKIKNIVIFLVTISVFAHLFYYMPNAKILNIPEYLSYGIILTVSIVFYVFEKKNINMSRELLIWIIFYYVLNTIFVMQTDFAIKEYKIYVSVIMNAIVFLSLSLLYNLDDENLFVTRKAVAAGVFIGAIFLVIDFLVPGYFAHDITTTAVAGRSIATYGNSNIAGTALVLGMLLSIDIIPKQLKFAYILLIFMGILATFSRGGIMSFFVITAIMVYQNKISKKVFLIMLSSIVSFLLFLIFGGFDLLATTFNIEITDNLISRVSFFVDNDNSETSDMDERKMVLFAALNLFADSPFFGDGFAATRLWEYRVGPHNTFAATLAEFGLFGLLIIPSFLYLSTYRVFKNYQKEHRDIGILFIIYYLSFSMFNHNMLVFDFNIAAAVIIATLGYKNIQKKTQL